MVPFIGPETNERKKSGMDGWRRCRRRENAAVIVVQGKTETENRSYIGRTKNSPIVKRGIPRGRDGKWEENEGRGVRGARSENKSLPRLLFSLSSTIEVFAGLLNVKSEPGEERQRN